MSSITAWPQNKIPRGSKFTALPVKVVVLPCAHGCTGPTCMCVCGCRRGCSNGVTRLCWLIAMLWTGAYVVGVATAAGAEVVVVIVMRLVDWTECAGPVCIDSSKRSENSELLVTNCSISVERERGRDNNTLNLQHIQVLYDFFLSMIRHSALYTSEQKKRQELRAPVYLPVPNWEK